ncbi:putative NADH-flavin reductase [Chryseobacterium sp. H1D6B]|uniref:NAD(P)-dependent oxidoreductase n=1 Tax=Chryseobacterium sp. H1D6B TaxID=2940588 RepID=UPI0015C904B2|nr:NAD(P)H-binding protein [Chryseobacterium sp. H1D6B]MDH6253440.1 putative NADH-flavin reductase [Chryseobacterium sp. H1D6B]
MNITIIGAAAGIGLAAVEQALSKGYNVTALSTNTSRMPEHPLLTKINGSATNVFDMKRAMTDADAVLVTIGTKDKKPNTLFSDTATALVSAGTELNLKSPIIVITGFGAGKSSSYLSFFMRMVIRFFLKNQYINKSLMEKIITESSLHWEMVRPGMLSDGPLTQQYKVYPQLYNGMKVGKISRSDVADFLLQQAINPTLAGQYPALSN